MFRKKRIIDISHEILERFINQGDILIDATLGTGKDCFYLYSRILNTGEIFAFDIQEEAINLSKQYFLQKLNFIPENINFILDSHANIDKYILDKKIKCGIFNLGYLPTKDSNKNIITNAENTIMAIKKILKNLASNGVILIVCYYAHDFQKEKILLESYLNNLDKNILVTKLDWINKKNNPPIIFIIENN